MKIVHQQQPTGSSCVCTCLAMLIGKPAQEVVDEFHAEYFDQGGTVDTFLNRHGLPYKRHHADATVPIEWGKVYLLTVPALNIKGLFHQILVDAQQIGNLRVLDPAQGLEGKLYYVPHDYDGEDPLAFRLCSYIVDYTITP